MKPIVQLGLVFCLVWPGVAAWGEKKIIPVETQAPVAGSGTVALDDEHFSVKDTGEILEPEPGKVDSPVLEKLLPPAQGLLDIRQDELITASEKASLRLDSPLPVEPWLSAIHRPPFLTVYPSIQKGAEIQEWSFSVADNAGNVLWLQRGQGMIPTSLAWNGQISQGGILDIETPFFYTLSVLDRGKNPVVVSGAPQILSAIAFPDEKQLLLRFASGRLFQARKEIMLSETGEALLRESLHDIFKGHHRQFRITAFADSEKLADLQAGVVMQYFLGKFTFARSAFSLQHQTVNDRFKIEIVCTP